MKHLLVTLLTLLAIVRGSNAQAVRSFTVTKDSVIGIVPNARVWSVTENSGSTWITGDSSLVAKADTSDLSVWTDLNSGIPDSVGIICLEFVSSSTIFAAGFDGAIYRTTNGGSSWNVVYHNLSETNFIDLIKFFDQNNGMAWGDGITQNSLAACLVTTDGGTTWTNKNSIIHGVSYPGGVCFAAPSYVFLCDRVNPGLDGIARSTDGGNSWVFGTVGNSSKDSTTYCHCVDFKNDRIGVAAREDSTFWSTVDGGATWQQIGFKAPTFHSYIKFVQGTNIAMAGGVNLASVAEIDLGSRTFAEYQDVTRPNTSFNNVNFPNVRRGYMSNGLNREFYSVVLPGTTGVVNETRMPSVLAMAQNYPNPFNPSTTIKFELPRTSQVNLTVFDILGREVSVLVNDKRDAGVYEVKFDGSGLASGVYFYRIQAGTSVQTKMLLLLR
ncbi:MAG TPA: T9SS type A sorting domain-containing protein [Bacteroidota bacterium]|nr:T9SS type A sorting domain-containing protein [Bacteroidota bacterium]